MSFKKEGIISINRKLSNIYRIYMIIIYVAECHTFSIFTPVSTQLMTGIKKKDNKRE